MSTNVVVPIRQSDTVLVLQELNCEPCGNDREVQLRLIESAVWRRMPCPHCRGLRPMGLAPPPVT